MEERGEEEMERGKGKERERRNGGQSYCVTRRVPGTRVPLAASLRALKGLRANTAVK